MNGRKKGDMSDGDASASENENERRKCDYGIVMCDSRKSFLRAYRERRRHARCPDCTLSRIRKIRYREEERNVKVRETLVKS